MNYNRKIMRLELSAEKALNGGYYYAELLLPAAGYEIKDAMQRTRAVGRENTVEVSILECDNRYFFADSGRKFSKCFAADIHCTSAGRRTTITLTVNACNNIVNYGARHRTQDMLRRVVFSSNHTCCSGIRTFTR